MIIYLKSSLLKLLENREKKYHVILILKIFAHSSLALKKVENRTCLQYLIQVFTLVFKVSIPLLSFGFIATSSTSH